MSAEVIEATAERLRVLAGAKTIALLEALAAGDASVQQLADRIAVSHQNASHHLRNLQRAGVIASRRDGPATIYAIEDWSSWWVVQQVADLVSSPAEG